MTRVPKGKVPADVAAPKHCDRDRVKTWVCGWCSNAARSVNPKHNHRRCPGHPCACGAVDHHFDRAIADVMVKVTRLDLDDIYAAHGRKRRVLSDEHLAKLQAGRKGATA